MKRNVLVPFLVFGSIASIMLYLFIYRIGFIFDGYQDESLKGQYLVNANDIQKSIRVFLKSQDTTELNSALKNSGYDLVLYDLQGRALFSNRYSYSLKGSEKMESSKNIDSSDNSNNYGDINRLLSKSDNRSRILVVNSQEDGSGQLAVAIIDTRQNVFDPDEMRLKVTRFMWSLFFAFIALAAILFMFIYFQILRPFDKLQHFTGEIAKGNLEAALPQDRRNLFGAFTWAFDMMRNELKASKEREVLAENTKKDLVAALSHDIRTPVASVKAYAECLKSLPDKNTPRAYHYVDVILSKTDEITKLSADMFMHAIMDVEKLEILPETYRSRELLNSIFEPLILQYENRIRITAMIPDAEICIDKQRLEQICENIIANSAKYSPDSDIHIIAAISEGFLKCCFRDFGQGVLPEDIPFLFDKFFRGKNARESGKPGSGLGLYISRYILERSGGGIKAFNWHDDVESGFQVEVYLKIKES